MTRHKALPRQTEQENRYFVVEHATGIVRAAQSTLRGAMRYTTPENCHERCIIGPMTPQQFQRLFATYYPS